MTNEEKTQVEKWVKDIEKEHAFWEISEKEATRRYNAVNSALRARNDFFLPNTDKWPWE